MHKTILFDFDGTIADSLRATIEVYNRIAPRYNAYPIQEKHIETFKSDRIQKFFKYLNLKYYLLPFMVLKGRSEFRKSIAEVKPQPGVCEVIKKLKADGHTLGVLSSNSQKNIESMMELYGLSECFDFIKTGKNMFGKHKCINKLVKEHSFDKENVWLVADETRDIESANKAGITMVAVTWGFQNRRAFKKLKPKHIVDTPTELYAIFQ